MRATTMVNPPAAAATAAAGASAGPTTINPTIVVAAERQVDSSRLDPSPRPLPSSWDEKEAKEREEEEEGEDDDEEDSSAPASPVTDNDGGGSGGGRDPEWRGKDEKSSPPTPTSPHTVDAAHAARFLAESLRHPDGSWSADGLFYPEGGLAAWLTVLGSFCSMAAGFGLTNTISTLNAYISSHQLAAYSEADISWIFSVFIFLIFFCGLQIGPVFDRYGPTWLLAAGGAMLFASTMCLGLCTRYWHFVLDFSLVGGVACSLLFTPAVSAVAHHFDRRRATLTGLACTGGSVGGTVYPLMLQALIPRVGFAWATRILAFILLFLCAVGVALVRSRLPPKRRSASAAADPGGASALKDILPDVRIFRDGDGAMALTTAGVFCLEWGLFVPTTYLTSYALANHVGSQAFSYQLIAIFNAASCFGRFLPGYVADRCGRFNTMLLFTALCLATAFGLWLPAGGSVALLVAFSVAFGFASGSNISLTPICVGQLCDTREYGRYYASCYTIVAVGSLTGIPIAGALVEACGGAYWGLIVFTGLCYAGALGCFLYVRVVRGGKVVKQRGGGGGWAGRW